MKPQIVHQKLTITAATAIIHFALPQLTSHVIFPVVVARSAVFCSGLDIFLFLLKRWQISEVTEINGFANGDRQNLGERERDIY